MIDLGSIELSSADGYGTQGVIPEVRNIVSVRSISAGTSPTVGHMKTN